MKNIVNKQKIFSILVAIITTVCTSINVFNNEIRFFGNDFKWILYLCAIYILIMNVFYKKNKRLFICTMIFGLIISFFYCVGIMANDYNFKLSNKDLLILLCRFEEYTVLITVITYLIMYNVSNNSIKEIRDWKLFTSNIKSIVFVTIILCIGYLPYILHYYPGNVLIDSVVQILQGQGAIPLTNHHPVLHTEIIAICMNIGHSLFGSYSSGAAIYTIGQTIITSFVFSFTIYYMARKNISVYIRVITLLFFMFCPTICFYTITMYKDIPFALSVLLATIGINEMVNNTSNFFKSKIRCIYLMLMITLIMFFRNNGVYAIVLSFPFIIIALKKYYRQILVIFLVPVVFYKIITGPIYNMANIEQGSTREALSIPLQQFARLMSYKENELTQEQKNKIRQYLPIENFQELYQPGFADPIKSNFSESGFEEDKIGIIKLYFELAIEYPVQTIESFIMGSFGYYFPNTVGWGVYTGVNTEMFGEYTEYQFSKNPIVKIDFLDKINEFVNSRDLPIISMFISIGFLFWIIILCIMLNIYNKKYRNILIFLPVVFIWLTALASPVFCEPRYVYSIFTCLPLFIGVTVNNGKIRKKEQ